MTTRKRAIDLVGTLARVHLRRAAAYKWLQRERPLFGRFPTDDELKTAGRAVDESIGGVKAWVTNRQVDLAVLDAMAVLHSDPDVGAYVRGLEAGTGRTEKLFIDAARRDVLAYL